MRKYCPETVIFVVDVDVQVGLEAHHPSTTRLDLIKQCIGMFMAAKARINSNHKFGLAVAKDTAFWEVTGLSDRPEGLSTALKNLQPSSQHFTRFDLGSLVSLAQPLLVTEEAEGAKVRVVLFYCRSDIVPTWDTYMGEGLPIDVIYLHEKPSDVNCPQQVYSAFEHLADDMAKHAGHSSYIFETNITNYRKTMAQMMWLLGHPLQRVPQHQLKMALPDLRSILAEIRPSSIPAAPGAQPSPALSPFISPSITPRTSSPQIGLDDHMPVPNSQQAQYPRSHSPQLPAPMPQPLGQSSSVPHQVQASIYQQQQSAFSSYNPLPTHPQPPSVPAASETPVSTQPQQLHMPPYAGTTHPRGQDTQMYPIPPSTTALEQGARIQVSSAPAIQGTASSGGLTQHSAPPHTPAYDAHQYAPAPQAMHHHAPPVPHPPSLDTTALPHQYHPQPTPPYNYAVSPTQSQPHVYHSYANQHPHYHPQAPSPPLPPYNPMQAIAISQHSQRTGSASLPDAHAHPASQPQHAPATSSPGQIMVDVVDYEPRSH